MNCLAHVTMPSCKRQVPHRRITLPSQFILDPVSHAFRLPLLFLLIRFVSLQVSQPVLFRPQMCEVCELSRWFDLLDHRVLDVFSPIKLFKLDLARTMSRFFQLCQVVNKFALEFLLVELDTCLSQTLLHFHVLDLLLLVYVDILVA